MIFELFLTNPLAAIVIALTVIIAISVHEAAHAFAADKLGDMTPRMQGRLTLNPLKHLDPWGTLLIFLVGIGWGKPVIFNPFALKNVKRDTMLIAIAGPTSNIIMALIAAILAALILPVANLSMGALSLKMIFEYFIYLNVVLAVFNMIPLDPLDGYKVVAGILPPGLAYKWEETRRYGLIVLIILMVTGYLDKILYPATNFLAAIFSVPMTLF